MPILHVLYSYTEYAYNYTLHPSNPSDFSLLFFIC